MSWIYILAILPILFLLGGIYYLFFAKQDQARQFVQSLLNDAPQNKSDLKRIQQQFILKKRRNQKTQKGFFQNLDMDIERANLYLKPNEFILISLAVALMVAGLIFLMGKGLLFALMGGVVGFYLPKFYVGLRIWLRMAKAARQFSEVLDTFVNCFKSGYSFSRAVQQVSERFDDPWSTELSKVAAEMNFGSSLEESLYGLAKRVPNADVSMFVTAVIIQKETGGNLAGLLATLSSTVRERYKLLSKVSALSAQGKLSALIIFLIPLGLAAINAAMFPEMFHRFTHHPIGIGAIVFAVGLQMIGGLCLKQIVTLEV